MEQLVAAVCAALAVALLVGDGSLRRLRPGRVERRPPPGWWTALRGQFASRSAVQHQQQVAAGVAMTCDLLAVCIEAGRPPRAALRAVAQVSEEPTASVLLGVWNQIDLGVDEPKAWRTLGEQPGYHAVARDIARSVGTGVALADLLRAHAVHARAAVVTETKARARRVGVSSIVPLMVCFLPAFGLVGIVPMIAGTFLQVVGQW